MVYQISSGQGPAECELGVARFLEHLKRHYDITVLDYSNGYYGETYRSVRFSTPEDLSCYVGSIQWVWQSTYRPGHKRKNWFLDFSECTLPIVEEFDEKQVVFETFRCGGNGGQNVNKVETGVRATYLPIGLSVVCTEERSQIQNKKKAIARLRSVIMRTNMQREAKLINDSWKRHTQIVRGKAIHKYVGLDFEPV